MLSYSYKIERDKVYICNDNTVEIFTIEELQSSRYSNMANSILENIIIRLDKELKEAKK